MTPAVNNLFDKIRLQLEGDLEEMGLLGLDDDEEDDDEEDDEEAEGGDLGASNPSDALDAFEAYIGGIADGLMAEYEIDEDDAVDFVLDIADDMADAGMLAELPDVEDSKALALWIGQAQSVGFGVEVMAAADEDAED